MADTKALRTRIKSVDSTLHTTKAMGLVASSKIRRATDGMMKSRQYSRAVDDVMKRLAENPECKRSAYMRSAPANGGKTKLIIIAGDRGLAGGYNANVFRLAAQYLSDNVSVIPIGKRACDRFRGDDMYPSCEKFSSADASALARRMTAQFAAGEFDRLGIIRTRYVSVLSQVAEIVWLLPLSEASFDDSAKKRKGGAPVGETAEMTAGMIFEPDEVSILSEVVPEFVAGRIAGAVRESFASEVAARRAAMDSAGKNAEDMIERLQLQYNRARQGAITQEITEIVAGAGQ